jgi:hypothetical protein
MDNLTDAQADAVRDAYRKTCAQGKGSYSKGSCKYRLKIGGKTLHCAVGQLFPPDADVAGIELHALSLNGHVHHALKRHRPELFAGNDGIRFLDLMSQMQASHDHAADYGDGFVNEFINECTEYNSLWAVIAADEL